MSNVHWETATMAELYLKQGQPERAIAIYRHVVRERPDNVAARRRLAQLEAGTAQGNEEGPMTFREHIQRIVDETPGAIACCIMGFDGIAIDSYEVGGAEVDVSVLFTEYASAAHQLRRAFDEQSLVGPMSEMVLSSSKYTTVVRPIIGEYFIAAVLSPDAVFGKARYLLRLAAPKLATELS